MAGIAPWGLLALAAAHGADPQSTGHAVRTVIVVEGTELPAVKVGDVVRLSRSAAAGRGEMSAVVHGPARLVSTTDVRRFVDGRPPLGAVVREFEIRAEKPGTATIQVETKDPVGKTSQVQEYRLLIE